MSKKIFLFLVFLVLCFGCAFIQYKKSVPVNKVTTSFTFSVTQTVGKNKQKIQTKVGSTALQLLNSAHKVVTKGQKENAFVTAIDGYTANSENKEFWAFYVNGKQAEVGAGSYVIKNHDTIEWKIETY
ncbi:MAG: DUF4430 domain-containing protein [Candidatus Roizmanbacteria bacterium]|nr:DUF4430 domain-containing protein [Candidatus Roizmanbacteria bacterium]